MSFIKKAMVFLFIFLFCATIGIRGDVITIYSSPELDGHITYHPWYGIGAGTADNEIISGDWWNFADMFEQYGRSYFSFDISVIDSGSSINSAALHIYQSQSVGDGQHGVFPIWSGVPGGETLFCIADHIDYGTMLDTTDWTAGDPWDPQTIETNVGLVSNNSGLGYKVLGGLEYCVQEDLDAVRGRTQFRVRFPIYTDDDNQSDRLRFFSGDEDSLRPYLEVDFTPACVKDAISKRNISNRNFISIYPNPGRSNISIRYTLQLSTFISVSIYDVTGRLVKTIINEKRDAGVYSERWNGNNNNNRRVAAGVYFTRLSSRDFTSVKKVILVR